MENAPKKATLGPVSNEVLEALIEVGKAHRAGQPTSEAEAVFYLCATPELLQELLNYRLAEEGRAWLNRPTNVVELAAHTPLHLVQPEGAA